MWVGYRPDQIWIDFSLNSDMFWWIWSTKIRNRFFKMTGSCHAGNFRIQFRDLRRSLLCTSLLCLEIISFEAEMAALVAG